MYLRVAVTDRCNLRCTYCLPERVRFAQPRATAAEIDHLMAAVCAAVPVRKIRLTGGEPTLSPHLPAHIRTARRLADDVGLTTNGVLLEPLLPELREAGLQRLNISLDAADADGFRRIARRDRFTAVLSAIRAARRLGFAPLKLNAVASAESDPAALARLAIAEGVHLRFIELMAVGEALAGWAERHVHAGRILERLFEAGLSLRSAPGRSSPACNVWTIAGIDPEQTTIGCIAPVSQPFCATCDRLRLTSRGRLHACLFDEDGTDLLPLLRSGGDGAMLAAIRTIASRKTAPARAQRHRVMAGIGG